MYTNTRHKDFRGSPITYTLRVQDNPEAAGSRDLHLKLTYRDEEVSCLLSTFHADEAIDDALIQNADKVVSQTIIRLQDEGYFRLPEFQPKLQKHWRYFCLVQEGLWPPLDTKLPRVVQYELVDYRVQLTLLAQKARELVAWAEQLKQAAHV